MTDKQSQPFQTVPRWVLAAGFAIASWFIATRILHVFHESINWDEFALLNRADSTLRLGSVSGGGRPGLVTIILMPFVRNCIDSVEAVVNARMLWMLLTTSYLVGVYWLVRRFFVFSGGERHGRAEGMLAVALIAFLPAFVTWSVQVRTDQVALAAAVWGGVFLLSMGYVSAATAGIFLALSLLSTQKGAYVIGLCGLLFATGTIQRAWMNGEFRRTAIVDSVARIAVAGLVAALILWAYSLIVPDVAQLISGKTVTSSMDTMRWTRERQGYRIYTVHSTRLIVHWILFALLLFWTVRCIVRRQFSEAVPVITCWLILLLGLLVIAFHGSSFPYFIMTAGLFPAIALSLTAGNSLARAGRMAWPALIALMTLAAVQSSPEAIEMLSDTQSTQRATLRLVYESNLKNRRGYQVEGALFCAGDPEPIPAMFTQNIMRRFQMSPQKSENIAAFIQDFRQRRVAYIVESYRLQQFPPEIKRFFGSHYAWYGGSLYLAGFRLNFRLDESSTVDVIVPGVYRWTPDSGFQTKPLILDGQLLTPLGTIHLSEGHHTVSVSDDSVSGSLILADLPTMERRGHPAFYLERQRHQLGGHR